MKRIKLVQQALMVGAACSAIATAHAQDTRVDISDRRGMQEMVVSVKFLDRAIDTYKEVAGWELAHRGMAPTAQATHWGLPSTVPIEEAVLRVPGTTKGYLRLVRFVGAEQVRIRSSARPFDTGAIFNFNALVSTLR